MRNPRPESITTRFLELPLSHLHIMEAGSGEPLIIVPATISELENWIALTQFMAQWFHAYFFELPGHGQSSAFEGGFSSFKVALLIEQFANALGIKKFNLMGFSFGGILAMQTFQHLSHRINRMITISPCVDHQAILIPPHRQSQLQKLNKFISRPRVRKQFNNLIHNKVTVNWIVKALRKFGRLEKTVPLERRLPQTPLSMLEVLNAQVSEILTVRFDAPAERHRTPCYFAMSIHDPLLDFNTTQDTLNRHFSNVHTVRLTYPFHQPPRQFTYDELNQDFYQTVHAFMQNGHHPAVIS